VKRSFQRIFQGVVVWLFVVAPQASATESLLAQVGQERISIEQFREEALTRGIAASQKEALLEEMVRFEALHAAALAEGLDRDPEILQALRQMVVGKYLENQLEPQLRAIEASDAEARAYYEANQQEFAIAAKVRAALIKIEVPRRISEKKRSQIEARAKQARKEALALAQEMTSFGSVAVRYSDDLSSRYRGGEVGWLLTGEKEYIWPEAVTEAIFALDKVGAVSELIATEDGFYLVKLMEKKEGFIRPFAELKDWCRNRAVKEKREALERRFYARVQQRVGVNIHPSLLQKVEVAPAVSAPPLLPGR